MVGVTIRDHFELRLNGSEIANDRIQRLHAPGGRDARIHSIRLEPYSQYVIRLKPDMLRRGDNCLRVTLKRKDPNLFGQIEVRELELFVCYACAEG